MEVKEMMDVAVEAAQAMKLLVILQREHTTTVAMDRN